MNQLDMALELEENAQMEQRLRNLIVALKEVSDLMPREKYLYPVMKGVPFCDLETALMMASMEHTGSARDTGDGAEV